MTEDEIAIASAEFEPWEIALADILLWDWYRWSAKYSPKLGAPGIAPYCKRFRSSRQYDEDAAYSSVFSRRMEAVDWCVDTLAVPMQQAIGTEMRNRIAKVKVWRSPAGATYSDAVDGVIQPMRSRGLLNKNSWLALQTQNK